MTDIERAAYNAGLRRAIEIVEASGKPGEGGIDITSGIPSCIYIAIGRGGYEGSFGDYGLAKDTANEVRAEIKAVIQYEIDKHAA